jgi:hypothetical protein
LLHVPIILLRRKNFRYPLRRKLGGSQSCSGWWIQRKARVHDGNESSVSQTVVSHLADRVISAPLLSDHTLDDREAGFDSRQRETIFPLASVSRQALRPTLPPIQLVPGVFSPGGKTQLERDADQSPPSIAISTFS